MRGAQKKKRKKDWIWANITVVRIIALMFSWRIWYQLDIPLIIKYLFIFKREAEEKKRKHGATRLRPIVNARNAKLQITLPFYLKNNQIQQEKSNESVTKNHIILEKKVDKV